MPEINRFECLLRSDATIREAISIMGSSPRNKHLAGMVVVVDEAGRVVGVVTDGDVRRGLSRGLDLDATVGEIANPNPLTVPHALSASEMRRVVIEKARERKSHYFKFDKLVLVGEDRVFQDVIALKDILEPKVDEMVVGVYGLGFVGLTLACTFANAGLSVVGIDTNADLVAGLRRGIPPFFEKGLDSMLSALSTTNPIHFTANAAERDIDVHVVSVGSPVNDEGEPDLSHIRAASRTIATRLKRGDLVVFRSTVPVGTMRGVALPLLEDSGLFCGSDFHLAFAPERTVEGNALEELRRLPQVVGGVNRTSTTLAARLFAGITSTIIEVNSLEEAELVKLMNNTFRDLVFAFSNEVASICDALNINAFQVISAANEGYPRDPIPMPSPGVGGVCLSKDPYLYTNPIVQLPSEPRLGRVSRAINGAGPDHVLRILGRFADHTGRNIADLNILLVGLAFKGMPETSDTRASVARELVGRLPDRGRIRIKDFVVPCAEIVELGCIPVETELAEAFEGIDAVLVMNNHYRNNRFNVVDALSRANEPVLFFDGWNMFGHREIEALPNVCYATMGYMTPRFRNRG